MIIKKTISINLLICFIFTFLIAACTSDVKSINNQEEIKSTHKLIKIGSKMFKLDKETAPQSSQYQIFRTKDSLEYLTFLNSYNNSIYFYDFNSEEFLFKNTYEKQGSNGVAGITGYHVHNLDSIFLYNYGLSKLFLFDSSQNLINSYKLEQNEKYSPSAKVATNSPISIWGEIVYMTGNIAGEYSNETAKNRPVLIKLNLETKQVDYQIGYPDIYKEANWGGGQYRWLSHYFNPVDSLLFFSFSVSHDVKFLDINSGKTFSYYMGSNHISEIPSVSSSTFINSVSKEKIRDHFIKNGSYQHVGYVPIDQFYFRKVWLPEMDYNQKKFNGFKVSFILMDRNFKNIGETIFPRKSYGDFVISKSGLYLEKYLEREDLLVFDQFKLKNVE